MKRELSNINQRKWA